ncbi:ubiquitin-like domain-containing protein [Clostridium aestuarii]|uniref:Ubiquitin-like domain-containing protein n=1 Tax=Clostridium aestuarii TaxID=338193 RepID=A0ABT4D1D3_9CLOT|nr:ubiquitin-like domain-containing protein [Clostridium aestuarii]MCY6484917.1 ubiquitin-like domain-containing protein [Clostridium aestuarii]
MFFKSKDDINDYFSNGPKVFFIAMLLVMCIITGIYGMEKNINIVIDGKEMCVITYRSTVNDILKNSNIALGPKDVVEPSLKSRIKSGDTIKIEKAIDIELQMDGKTQTVATTADNVGEMLKAEGITLGQEDRVQPLREEEIKDGLKIMVTRVNTTMEKKVQSIEFSTEIKKDGNLNQGVKKIIKEGTEGQKEIIEKIVYENGKEVTREVVEEKITKQPTNKVVAMGTLNTLNLSRGSINYTKKIRMRATAYTASFKDTGKRPGDKYFAITASGTKVKRNPNGYSTVAVDPRVIPLGTKVYVEGYGYAIAEDTGGAIKGNRIDLYFNTDRDVDKFGVRYLNVYVTK